MCFYGDFFMSDQLRRLFGEIVIFSALASDFEQLDFKNDALAGVRANFFNSGGADQTEKTDITVDGRVYSLSYAMRSGAPLSWKMTCGLNPAQTVKPAADGSYSVLSYGANGVVFKRQFFDAAHLWLRTEYYDRALENRVAAVLYPKRADGLVVLRLQRFLQEGISSCDLYPSLTAPKHRCEALIYTNAGMLWYDESFQPVLTDDRADEKQKDGFRFDPKAFTAANASDVLRLQEAPYLSEADLPHAAEETAFKAPVPKEYSAYDTIERILLEAQKTNQNVLGNPNDEMQTKDVQEQPSVPPETVTETVHEQRSAEPETVQPCEEPSPDTQIHTSSGTYAYYGQLNGDGERNGRGRTVTPDGLTAYDGDYLCDKRHGFGVCYYKDGSPNYFGDWHNGNRSGCGAGFRLSDGTMHAGRWSDNKPEGFGARFDRDGNFLDVCTYVDGKRSGKSVSFDADGNVVIRLWKDGEVVSEKIISD